MKVEGCSIEPVESDRCKKFIEWVRGQEARSEDGFRWLLAHCDDGVVWGKYEGGWRFGSDYFDICPRVSETNLIEMRVFGDDRELLIWRTEEGLKGRLLKDKAPLPKDAPTRWDDEKRILAGNKFIASRGGFTRIGTSSGAEQVVPLELSRTDNTCYLKVRNYFEQDSETGAVRVAVTRLISLEKEK